jgi:broad specificity phosphatase PhoE
LEIIFVRHGESIGNALKGDDAVYTGRWDCDLTEKGYAQARALIGNPELEGVEVCFVSPLKRALETARIICNVEPCVEPRIMERSLGEFEEKKICDVMKIPKYEKYFTDPEYMKFRSSFTANAPGGESYADVCRRVEPFALELTSSGYKKVLVVAHFVVIRCLIKLLKGLSEEETLALKVPNCQPILVVFEEEVNVLLHGATRVDHGK